MFKESDIVLSAKHIVKQFPASHGRTLTACNDINLNVYKGKTLGIVGESGCGVGQGVGAMADNKAIVLIVIFFNGGRD